MDDILPKLVQELAAHDIRVMPDGTVLICGSQGCQNGKQMPILQAIAHIQQNIEKNASYLSGLWQEAAARCKAEGVFPSNEDTRRLFISAVKHLLKQAYEFKAIQYGGAETYEAFHKASRHDISVFSEGVQSDIIEYRIAIDWVSHLVSYDRYRCELLETYASMKSRETTKLAFGPFQRDLSIPEEQAIPWSLWKDHLLKTRGEGTPSNEEKDPRERDMELRTELGLADTSEHGFLDDYDEIAHGKNFKQRMKGSMMSFWDKNQKMKDFSSGEYGIRNWNDKTNLAPHEQGLK